MTGENNGIPAVAIMTEQFVSAAALMATVLGADGYEFVVVDHPISSADEDGLVRRARSAAEECARLLTASA